jgi:hypothetical protein
MLSLTHEQSKNSPSSQGRVNAPSLGYVCRRAGFHQDDKLSSTSKDVNIGQTYEKLSDKEKASEYYRKASTAIAHNPAAAYAVPLAKKKLASLAS